MKRSVLVSVFETKLGWFALAGTERGISWCTIGHATRDAAKRSARAVFGNQVALHDWHPKARRRLTAFAAGTRVIFDDLDLDLDSVPAFQRTVLAACRKIAYGATLSYSELARAAGRPRAVRAVGTAMARNPVPIIVPCHRVLRSNGGLGGYSAAQGVPLKAKILELESQARRAAMHTTHDQPARHPTRSRLSARSRQTA